MSSQQQQGKNVNETQGKKIWELVIFWTTSASHSHIGSS